MNHTQKPLYHGVVLIAGGAIGAGMFALPLVASGAWLWWSAVGLIAVMLLTFLAADLLLEVHKRFDVGVSFHTLVTNSLGKNWATLNNVSIAFIMMILMYAYITAGGGMFSRTLAASLSNSGWVIPRSLLSAAFALLIALFVYFGATLVSRFTLLLLLIMLISFALVSSVLLPGIDYQTLFSSTGDGQFSGLATAVPVFVTALACGGLVPSLVDHYRATPHKPRQAILSGLCVTTMIYLLWLSLCFGSLGNESLSSLQQQNAGMSELLTSLQAQSTSQSALGLLTWFSHFAVITSFLSIALGLVHFFIDRFDFASKARSTETNTRGKAVLLAFLPCTLASMLFPYGFVLAISYAGLLVSFSFFVVPALLHRHHYGLGAKSVLVFLGGLVAMTLKAWIMLAP